MQQTIISLMRFPGGENDGGGIAPEPEEVNSENAGLDSTGTPKKKGFIDKVKDALRDWSNEDQKDQDIDDATP